jgi:hypothetical protein
MNALKPPALATWLLNRLAPGERRESLIGDLIEQHQRGRSSAWYWRQTVSAMGVHFAATLWRCKWVTIGVIALNTILPYLYLSFISHWVVVVDMAWYPHLVRWLIETKGITVYHAAYGLTTGITNQVAWCVLISSVAWIFVRLQSEARRTVVTLLVLFEIGQCIPSLRHTSAAWWHDPADLSGFLTALRFAIFMFVAIPFSILWGGRVASWQGEREPAV